MKRVFLIVISLIAIFSSLFIIAEHFSYTDEAYVRERIGALHESPGGAWIAAGVIVGLLWIDLLLPVPSSVVMTVSGMIFGLWTGALVSFVGATGAAVIGFFACRRGGHAMFKRLIADDDIRAIDRWFQSWGAAAIILSRPVPMMTEVLSCLAGLSDLKTRTFLVAATLGHIPVAIVYAWAGARGGLNNPTLAAAVALGIPAAGWLVVRRMKRTETAERGDGR